MIASTLTACGGCGEDVNPSVDPYFEPLEYGQWTPTRVPDISAPDEILFGDVAVGDSRSEIFEVRNVGRETLKFNSWRLDGEDFRMEFPEFMDESQPTRLEPGESVQVSVTFTARTDEGTIGRLLIGSDDPDESFVVVELLGNIKRPCLSIVPDTGISFGVADLNETARRSLRLVSCSPNAVTTVDVTEFFPGDPAVFDYVGPDFIELDPGEAVAIPVEFTPPVPGPYRGSWTLVTNEEEDNVYEVPVVGEGAPYECPEAVINARAPERTSSVADPEGQFLAVPLDVLEFDGGRSRAFDGATIESYEWSIIQRPTDSSAAMSAEGTPTNSLFLDLSGDYIVELNVIDSRGTRSCAPARMAIEAIPDEDIHVQLVWDTPNDNNQLDGVGSDVDVHLLHPRGDWNARPYDCFWQNLSPDWGRAGDPTDDPSLDIDDVDGWGPENINYNNPENDRLYSVGVHYFSDHSYGASYATLRIYLGGRLVVEQRRKRLSDQQFWHALDIDWPAQEIVEVDRVYSTFPSSF